METDTYRKVSTTFRKHKFSMYQLWKKYQLCEKNYHRQSNSQLNDDVKIKFNPQEEVKRKLLVLNVNNNLKRQEIAFQMKNPTYGLSLVIGFKSQGTNKLVVSENRKNCDRKANIHLNDFVKIKFKPQEEVKSTNVNNHLDNEVIDDNEVKDTIKFKPQEEIKRKLLNVNNNLDKEVVEVIEANEVKGVIKRSLKESIKNLKTENLNAPWRTSRIQTQTLNGNLSLLTSAM